jgi:hypothetical protein
MAWVYEEMDKYIHDEIERMVNDGTIQEPDKDLKIIAVVAGYWYDAYKDIEKEVRQKTEN